jgi:hypothetical protein
MQENLNTKDTKYTKVLKAFKGFPLCPFVTFVFKGFAFPACPGQDFRQDFAIIRRDLGNLVAQDSLRRNIV